MASQIDSYSIPPAVKRVASAFRLTGTISFWAQIILAIVATLVLIFASTSLNARGTANPGTGVGLFFAVFGLITLYAGAYWAFTYIRLGKRLKTADSKLRPKRADVIQALRIGLIINLIGMLLTLLGAQSIVGVLLAKSLAQPQAGAIIAAETQRLFIQPLDIFVVQANTNTVMAHFIGVVSSIWLIRSMNRP